MRRENIDKFTFELAEQTVTFGIERCKYLVGKNHALRYDLYRTLNQCFSKTKNSEYAIRENSSRKLTINDKTVDLKHHSFHLVTAYFDLAEAMKLKSDSLILKYIQSKLKNIEYAEEFNTLKILFEDFATYLDAMTNDFDGFDLNVDLKELTVKSLLKLIDVGFMKDEEVINVHDLSYEETVMHQFRMIVEVAKTIPDKTFIVYCDIPELTESIWELLGSLPDNTRVIMNTDPPKHYDVADILLLGHDSVDCADEYHVHESLTMNLEHCNTNADTIQLIRQYLSGQRNAQTSMLEAIL